MPRPPEKFPPPFRWLKRILLAYAILIPALIATWFTWSWYAHRALQKQIDAAHARGEPIEPEDFDRLLPTVDPAKNAALHYERAATLCVWTSAQDRWDRDRNYNDPPDYDMAASISDTCRAALDEAYLGATFSQARWSTLPSAEIYGTAWPSYGRLRRVVNTLKLAAEYHHHIHDDAAALRDVATILHCADSHRPAPALMGSVVATAFEEVACSALMEILPDISIGTDHKQADPQSARALLARLLDDKERIPSRLRSWYGERSFAIYFEDSGMSRTFGLTMESILKKTPLRPLAEARNAALLTSIANSVAQPFYPDMHLIYDPAPPLPEPRSLGEDFATTWDYGVNAFRRAVLLEQRSIADRRLAATAIAIRLWRADHPGAPFTSLEDLVPAYLAEIPADPLAPDHHTLRYQPAGEVPRLYSVGDDGVDDHGTLRDKNGGYSYGRFQALDLNFCLEPWARPTSP